MGINRLLIFTVACLALTCLSARAQVKIIQTVAGTGTAGFSGDGSPATGAKLNAQYMIATDAAGNVYIADNGNACVRKYDPVTNIITTIAGIGGSGGFSGDFGPATAAQLGAAGANPGVVGIAVDGPGNFVYICDGTNNRIRKLTMATGIIGTICGNGTAGYSPDGTAAIASVISAPRGIAVDGAGNLYFSDAGNQRIRMISAATGTILTIAGDGTAGYTADNVAGTATHINNVRGVTTDAAGNVYIADQTNNRIRKIDAGTGIITTVAGNGTGGFTGDGVAATATRLNLPTDMKFDAAGNMYIADVSNARIRMVNTAGIISTVAGSGTAGYAPPGDGVAATAGRLNSPISVAIDPAGRFFYISDRNNNRLRQVRPNSTPVFTGGSHQTLTVCQNSVANPINTLLSVRDSDVNQTETWTVTVPPTGGSALVAGTGTSTGGAITPTGKSYSPNFGFSGLDSFVVNVSDGFNSTLDTIVVTVTPFPVVAPITGPNTECFGSSVTVTSATPGGVWSATNTNATVAGGIITGITIGIDTINYTVTSACGSTTVVFVDTIVGAPSPITGTFSVCQGATTTLSDAGGGSWSSGNTAIATVGSATGIVTGTGTGTTNITYSLGGSCFVTASVTVNGAPAAITPAGAVVLCVGSSTTLADATPSGTWSTDAPSVASVSGGGTVLGLSAGTVNISYTALGCSVGKAVTIAVTPAALSPASLTVCPGTSAPFTETVSGGIWTSGAPATATVSGSGLVTGVSAGTTTISYAIGTCRVTAPVTVNAAPAAITPSTAVTMCAGASVLLSDPTPGGSWSSGNSAIATVGSAGLVTGVAAGTVNITYTSVAGCPAIKTVTVLPTPAPLVPSSIVVCTGATTTLSESVSGGVWGSSFPGVASVAAGVVTGVSGGTATISYTIGTCFVTAPVTVSLSPAAGTIVGPSSVCAGSPVLYTDAAPGGTWTSTNPSVATVSSTGLVLGLTVGTTTISYTVTNTCGTIAATRLVSVGLAPSAGTIIGTTLLCVGTSTILVDTTAGGAWSASNANAFISGSGLLTAVSPGTDTIYYSITNACGTVSATKIVSIGAAVTVAPVAGPGGVCVGSAITLTDATPGGSWTSSNAAASVTSGGVVTGLAPGTDTISYTYTSGCGSVAATHIVVVTPVPAAGTITGPSLLCAGGSATYTETATGGVWTTTNGNATISGGFLSALTPGIDTIQYIVANSCGVHIDVAYLTIGAPLSAGSISGPGAVCTGAVITLTDATPGGLWTSSNASATVFGGIVTGVTPGTDTISYTVSSSCGSVSATAVIAINPLPVAGTVSGPTSLCAGTPALYTATAPGGIWSSSNGSATISSGGMASPLSAGIDTFTYSVTNSCGTASATAIATILSAPAAGTITGASVVCTGAAITLTDAAPGGTWSASNASATVAGGVVTGITAGTDTIAYTVSGACGTATATLTITVDAAPFAGTITGLPYTCLAATTTLADAMPGGTWSATNTHATVTASGLVTGVTAGIDTISYTITNGCGTDVASLTVTVSAAPPSAGTIAGPAVVCAGGSILLTDAVPGGVWNSSSTNATVAGGVVTGVTPGSAAISYTVTNGCGAATATAIITIGAALDAGAITGPADVCTGSSIALTDPAAGGAWSVSNAHAAISGGTLTGITSGTDTVYYTVSGSCGTVSAMHVVTVSVAPAAGLILGASVVCTGATVTLTNAATGGVWSASNAKATVTGTGVVAGIITGIDTIRYTVSNGCGTAVATHPVSVSNLPSAGSITGAASVCPGAVITLGHTGSVGAWTSSSTAVATVSATGLVTGVASGAAVISYTVTNACGHNSTIHPVTVLASSLCGSVQVPVAPAAEDQLVVTPNPSNGVFTISLTSAVDEPVSIIITNLIGARVKEMTAATNRVVDIRMSEPSGIYLVTATTGSGRHVVRIVIN